MISAFPVPSRRALATIAGPVVVAGSLALIGTSWAAGNPMLAAFLFCWLVADGLMLATIAKHESSRPGPRALLGALAAASLVVLVGSHGPVREAIMAMRAVPAALLLTVAAYCGWSGWKAVVTWRAEGSLEEGLAQIFPRPFVTLALAEARVLHLALFRWGAPADIPAGAQGFGYHRYLAPMLAVLLVLQLIELGAVHVLVMLWNPTLAWVLLGISAWGAVWILALLKSLRLKPILLTDEGVRVRAGFLVDVNVPLDDIAEVGSSFGSQEVRAKTTLNAALVSWPQFLVELRGPLAVPGLFGANRNVERVAFKLDDPAAFRAELDRRLAERATPSRA